MTNRFYVSNYDALTEKEQTKLRQRYVCQECGEWLTYWLEPGKGTYLACHRQNSNQHDGIAREFIPPDERLIIARRESMETGMVNVNRAIADKNLPTTGRMNETQALQVCRVYWPDAPDTNIQAAAYLCRDYGLHPGANHIYLVPYAKKDKDGKVIGYQWEMLWSIAAKRLVAMRVKGQYSYIDDTPRIMSEAEEIKIFGRVDKNKVRAITKLRNMQGMEVSGHGEIATTATVKGSDKGNSLLNMAMVRSESRALDRLPGDTSLPVIEAIDASYAVIDDGKTVDTVTGEIIGDEAEEEEIDMRGEFEKEGRDLVEEVMKKTAPVKTKEPAPEAAESVLHPGAVDTDTVTPTETEAQAETPLAATSPIDLVWLKEQLGILQGHKIEAWTNSAVVGKLAGITGRKAANVSEAVSYLSAEQAELFIKRINDTIAVL